MRDLVDRILLLNGSPRARFGLEAAIHLAGIALENLAPLGIAQPRRLVDVALGVIEVKTGLRVDPLDRADHLGREQDVVGRHHFGEQIDAWLMIDAGVEKNIVADNLGKFRTTVVEREAAEAAPMKRHRAAAMRN